jgi:hypothetical protein
MNAYEIRLELLKMAKNILFEAWITNKNALEQVYYQEREISMRDEIDEQVILYPQLPKPPTSDDITKLASDLDKFVSN